MIHNEKCKYCGAEGEHPVTLETNTQHYARVTCRECKRCLRFLPKPDSDPTKFKRPAAHRDLVERFGRGFCEMCLRRVEDLPERQTLKGHHVLEFKDGGEPRRENVWVLCSGCERLVHWVRAYHGCVETIGNVLKEWPQ